MKREFTWSLYNEPEITGQGYVMCKNYRKNNNNDRDKEKAGWITFHLFRLQCVSSVDEECLTSLSNLITISI